MLYPPPRIIKCRKARQMVHISEDYEMIDGVRTLVRSSCKQCTAEATGYKCNGWNEDNSALCVYNSYKR